MSFLSKVKTEAANDCVSLLVKSLYQAVGNKQFMRDVERIFQERLADLDWGDSETLCLLARALRSLDQDIADDIYKKKPWLR